MRVWVIIFDNHVSNIASYDISALCIWICTAAIPESKLLYSSHSSPLLSSIPWCTWNTLPLQPKFIYLYTYFWRQAQVLHLLTTCVKSYPPTRCFRKCNITEVMNYSCAASMPGFQSQVPSCPTVYCWEVTGLLWNSESSPVKMWGEIWEAPDSHGYSKYSVIIVHVRRSLSLAQNNELSVCQTLSFALLFFSPSLGVLFSSMNCHNTLKFWGILLIQT